MTTTMPLERRQLKFTSADEAIADLERLRVGHERTTGNWTLAQACWHLNVTTQFVMRPGPYPADTPEQKFWHWFAIGVLLFCWIAEATLCADRGF